MPRVWAARNCSATRLLGIQLLALGAAAEAAASWGAVCDQLTQLDERERFALSMNFKESENHTKWEEKEDREMHLAIVALSPDKGHGRRCSVFDSLDVVLSLSLSTGLYYMTIFLDKTLALRNCYQKTLVLFDYYSIHHLSSFLGLNSVNV